MAIPISRAPSNSGAIGRRGLTEPLRSVFESEFDNSVKEDGVGIARRWKFKGPWLASQTEGEFQEYTMKKINKRKLEFKQFLREHLAEKMSVSQRRASMEAGQEGVESVVVSDKDLQAYIMDLRRDTPSLHSLIERFLDLPNDMELPDRSFAEAGEEDPSKRGPPTTHPSAGLSYLRTSSHIHNHPILGPQAENQPFQGRVLMPYSNMRGRKRARLLIGVGGVAAVGDQVQFWQQHQHPGLATFDPDIPGGAKIWVHPLHAHIDPQGRIKLKVKKVEDNTLAIYEGIVDEEAVLPRVDTKNRDFPDSLSPAQSATRSTRGYGLESEGRVRSYSRAEPIPDTNTQDIVDMLKHGMRPGKP